MATSKDGTKDTKQDMNKDGASTLATEINNLHLAIENRALKHEVSALSRRNDAQRRSLKYLQDKHHIPVPKLDPGNGKDDETVKSIEWNDVEWIRKPDYNTMYSRYQEYVSSRRRTDSYIKDILFSVNTAV